MVKTERNLGRISVADYVTQQIAMSGKSQKDIAAELGYDKPNIITMFKQGMTKVPINKIPLFSRVLGVDPVHFLRIAMAEYAPQTWETLNDLIGDYLMTSNEAEIIEAVREASGGIDVVMTSTTKQELQELVAKWREREWSTEDSRVANNEASLKRARLNAMKG